MWCIFPWQIYTEIKTQPHMNVHCRISLNASQTFALSNDITTGIRIELIRWQRKPTFWEIFSAGILSKSCVSFESEEVWPYTFGFDDPQALTDQILLWMVELKQTWVIIIIVFWTLIHTNLFMFPVWIFPSDWPPGINIVMWFANKGHCMQSELSFEQLLSS